MGKTETIKERAVYVYLPSVETKEQWTRYAEKMGTSLSKFVIECVREYVEEREDPTFVKRGELVREAGKLKERVRTLSEDLEARNALITRLEEEIRRYRAQIFSDKEFQGIRTYDKRLIETLKAGDIVSDDHLLAELGAGPRDPDAVKAISGQLEGLRAYGLVERTPKGWRWKG
ncbi:MAG: hypothetical protein ACE5QF_07940 [Thermoplasmata archaeon]